MSNKKISLSQTLHKNRSLVFSLLGVPVLGMTIAFVLVIYKQPSNMRFVLVVIFVLAVQYIVMMFFLLERIEMYAKREQQEDLRDLDSEAEMKKSEIEELIFNKESMLSPEEERVLPSEKEKQSY